jgi:preprotein translocase subunit YajC
MKMNVWAGAGLFLFPATVLADVAGVMGSGEWRAQGVMLAAFAFIFYFLILRPQTKRAKQHKSLVLGLQKGDEVITAGGLLGRISRVTDDFLVVAISEGTEVVVQKQAIAGSIPKGTLKNI